MQPEAVRGDAQAHRDEGDVEAGKAVTQASISLSTETAEVTMEVTGVDARVQQHDLAQRVQVVGNHTPCAVSRAMLRGGHVLASSK